MISITDEEWAENNIAFKQVSIKFLGMTVYKNILSTTNKNTVSTLSTKKTTKIKGFKNEN